MRAVETLTGWEQMLEERLGELERRQLLRTLYPVERPVDPVVRRGGRSLVNLSSNNYLGLAGHPALEEAMRAATSRGAGATASRLVVGTDSAHAELEEKMAAFTGAGAALVFGSGYLANVGILSAVVDREDAVFCDRLNHASIWDGVRLARAELYRYRHGDADHLAEMLKRAERRGVRRKLIVTETVFSMDGDVAPLEAIVELKERFGAALIVDEAHAGGVFGPHGEGYAHEAGVADLVDLRVGTFGKAFGVYGAYAAGSETWIRYLVNTCRSFVYTTALPPAVIGGIDAALDLVRAAGDLRQTLRERSERFRSGLQTLGFDVRGSTTQIVPAVVGSSDRALDLGRALEEQGVLAIPIRPPTVPNGTARIRFSLTSQHANGDIDHALSAIEAVLTAGAQ